MRTFIASLFLVAAFACDPNPGTNVEPRALPDPELCKALAQVCPVGKPDCQDMHDLCLGGHQCKACIVATELSVDLVAVCEDFHAYSECELACS